MIEEQKKGIRRLLWLMKCLETSMCKGCHISKDLFIPKDVWFQMGGNLFAQSAKISFCAALSELLKELSKVDVYNPRSVVAVCMHQQL